MANSPFKLLESYGAGDKDQFFGRDQESFALYNLLQQCRLVLVYGASGTGKTSLINAGLPKVFKIADWYKVSVKRRDDINASLRSAVESQLSAPLEEGDLAGAVRRIFEERWIPVYLVFDQFEEIFTLSHEQERLTFFENLKAILQDNTAVKVILSMREEYIGHLYDYEHIVPGLFDNRFRVEAMRDETVAAVIHRTCRVHGVQLERGPETAGAILKRLKEPAKKQPVHLPYMQIYLHALFGRALELDGKPRFTGDIIADKDYSLDQVLNRFISGKIAETQAFLEPTYPGLPADFAENLLDHFATDAGTKRALRVGELAARMRRPPELIRAALRFFDEEAKLLRADENDVDRYEPVHDTAARQIHELRTAENKEYKAFLRHLEINHAQWEKDRRPSERLMVERDAAQAELYESRLEKEENGAAYLEYLRLSREHHVTQRDWALRKLAEERALRKLAEQAKDEAELQRELAEEAWEEAANATHNQEAYLFYFTQYWLLVGFFLYVVIGLFFVDVLELNIIAWWVTSGLVLTIIRFILRPWLLKVLAQRKTKEKVDGLENVEREKAATEEQRKKAKENASLAEKRRKEIQEAFEEAASDEIVDARISEAEDLIYRLDYAGADAKLRTAAELDQPTAAFKKVLAELAFYWNEAGQLTRATDLLLLSKQTGAPNDQAGLRAWLKQYAGTWYDSLMERYYPVMLPVPGGEADSQGVKVPVSAFKIARTETTIWQYALYVAAQGKDLSEDKKLATMSWGINGDNPMVNVSWFDAALYANWLSRRFGRWEVYELGEVSEGTHGDYYKNLKINSAANGYRLPTELEWEYAARGGSAQEKFEYVGSDNLDSVGWFFVNSDNRTQRVASKNSNSLGLYDMSGNAQEWCQDWYTVGASRVVRGGSWRFTYGDCRVSSRGGAFPMFRLDRIGFRLVFVQ